MLAFESAVNGRKLMEMWRIARIIAGKNKGPKGRAYNLAVAVSLDVDTWAKYMEGEARKGGVEARTWKIEDEKGNERRRLEGEVRAGRPAGGCTHCAEPRGELTLLILPATATTVAWTDAEVRAALEML